MKRYQKIQKAKGFYLNFFKTIKKIKIWECQILCRHVDNVMLTKIIYPSVSA